MTNGSNEMVMPVTPMYGGYGNGSNGCFGGDWAWIILLLLLAGNGWGNGFGGDGDGRYSERGSYRDGRSYDGYSGHNKEDMIGHLQEMMRNARSEEEKESYRRAIEQMKR